MQIHPRFGSAFRVPSTARPTQLLEALCQQLGKDAFASTWHYTRVMLLADAPQSSGHADVGSYLYIGTGPDKENRGEDKFQSPKQPSSLALLKGSFQKWLGIPLPEEPLNQKIHAILKQANISYEFLP